MAVTVASLCVAAVAGLDMAGGQADDSITDKVLGQYDKVQRSKARWKINLRDCILTLDGRDYLLHKLNGEFQF